MRKLRRPALLFLVAVLMASAIMSSCSVVQEKETIKPYKDFAENEPYRITYTTEEGVEGCVAEIEYHPYYEDEFVLEIPDTSPDGKAVTKVSSNPLLAMVPHYMLEEDFEEMKSWVEEYFGVTYEDAQIYRYEKNHPLAFASFYVCKFMSYFVLMSRADVESRDYESEEKRQAAIRNLEEAYPLTAFGINVYVLDKAATTLEVDKEWLTIRQANPGWSDSWSYEALLNLQAACKEHSVQDPLVDSLLEKYSGLGQNLTEIRWPSGLTAIGDRAFLGCSSLKSVTLPGTIHSEKIVDEFDSSNYYWIGGCGDTAFGYCTSLEEFILADGINFIGDGVLAGNRWMKKIVLPASLEYAGVLYYDFLYEEVEEGEQVSLPTVEFHGTKAQWEAANMRRDINGNFYLGYSAYEYMTVHCSDGTIEAAPWPKQTP